MFIPTLTQIKLAAVGAAILGAAWLGRSYTAAQYEREIAEQNRKVAELQAENEKKTVKVVTRYVERVAEVKANTAALKSEIHTHVTPSADASCVVPSGFVRVHDAAANGDSSAAGGSDDAPSGVALSAVAATVTDNYGTCRENAEQLRALQDWIRATHGPQVSQPQ